MDTQNLRERWVRLCVKYGAWQPIADSVWKKMEKRYAEPWRFYHVLRHISDMLQEFDGIKRLLEDPDVVEFAIWLHDIIYDCYDSRIKNNEERSGQKAEGYLWKMFGHLPWHLAYVRMVQAKIRATKHVPGAYDLDTQYLLDIDLSIFGRPEQTYDAYAKAIANEFTPRPYPRQKYCTGRIAVLKSFLERERIYYTPHFFRKYETQARKNLTREIASLEAELAPMPSLTLGTEDSDGSCFGHFDRD